MQLHLIHVGFDTFHTIFCRSCFCSLCWSIGVFRPQLFVLHLVSANDAAPAAIAMLAAENAQAQQQADRAAAEADRLSQQALAEQTAAAEAAAAQEQAAQEAILRAQEAAKAAAAAAEAQQAASDAAIQRANAAKLAAQKAREAAAAASKALKEREAAQRMAAAKSTVQQVESTRALQLAGRRSVYLQLSHTAGFHAWPVRVFLQPNNVRSVSVSSRSCVRSSCSSNWMKNANVLVCRVSLVSREIQC